MLQSEEGRGVRTSVTEWWDQWIRSPVGLRNHQRPGERELESAEVTIIGLQMLQVRFPWWLKEMTGRQSNR